MRATNKEQRVWGEKGELPLLSPLHLADKLIKRELVPETDVTPSLLSGGRRGGEFHRRRHAFLSAVMEFTDTLVVHPLLEFPKFKLRKKKGEEII